MCRLEIRETGKGSMLRVETARGLKGTAWDRLKGRRSSPPSRNQRRWRSLYRRQTGKVAAT
eukprot:6206288-Pleurochrysis_carterae.AAC.4